VIGTSIGAINASLIAGNPPGQRLQRLEEFWRRVTHPPLSQLSAMTPLLGSWAANMLTIAGGLTDFFWPNPLAVLGLAPLGTERAGFYSLAPLERTLEELIDPVQLNTGRPRLTVGAAKVQTGEMHYFDSRDCELTIRHVMHVVRLLAPPLAGEDHAKDIDFSRSGIRQRWQAGYADTKHVLAQAPWQGEFDPLEGFILHEARAGQMMPET
jgi:hypothetical protein